MGLLIGSKSNVPTPFDLQVREYEGNVISTTIWAYVPKLAPKAAYFLLLL